jgi:hypothetical protein
MHIPQGVPYTKNGHPELDSGFPGGGQDFVRGDSDMSEANARPQSASGVTHDVG